MSALALDSTHAKGERSQQRKPSQRGPWTASAWVRPGQDTQGPGPRVLPFCSRKQALPDSLPCSPTPIISQEQEEAGQGPGEQEVRAGLQSGAQGLQGIRGPGLPGRGLVPLSGCPSVLLSLLSEFPLGSGGGLFNLSLSVPLSPHPEASPALTERSKSGSRHLPLVKLLPSGSPEWVSVS